MSGIPRSTPLANLDQVIRLREGIFIVSLTEVDHAAASSHRLRWPRTLIEFGIDASDIFTKQKLELPGYYRSTKKWDLLVVSRGQLVMAVEFKSIGGSYGNNLNNRTEEALGNASDIWTAYREGRFGTASRPLLGYLFLVRDEPKVLRPVANKEPHFKVDPAFTGASYAKRAEILCHRLRPPDLGPRYAGKRSSYLLTDVVFGRTSSVRVTLGDGKKKWYLP